MQPAQQNQTTEHNSCHVCGIPAREYRSRYYHRHNRQTILCPSTRTYKLRVLGHIQVQAVQMHSKIHESSGYRLVLCDFVSLVCFYVHLLQTKITNLKASTYWHKWNHLQTDRLTNQLINKQKTNKLINAVV
jgi:hypothetical protein